MSVRPQQNNKTAGAGTGNGNGIHGTRTEHGAARIYTSLPEFIRRAYGHFKIGAPGNTVSVPRRADISAPRGHSLYPRGQRTDKNLMG